MELDFPLEALGLVRDGTVVQQYLHGLDTARHTVFDLEDAADAARAEQGNDFVGPYRISDSKAHSLDLARTPTLFAGSRFTAFLPLRDGAGPTLTSQL